MEDTRERRLIAHGELEVSGGMAELPVIRRFLREFWNSLPSSPDRPEMIAQLELAITEAVANIVKHACAGRCDGTLRVRAEACPDCISLQIHHGGGSFDPSSIPPPSFDGSREGGFGLYMMSQCMDEVSYLQDETGKNYTRLVKRWS
ncbi:MAG: ATP-binding protein [Armatimonadota bacterium]|nr:ATP-binding protein [Armatimonadota bacterium]